ncbi:hypothetical protein AMTRI_Chr01g135070 [Amborella trichopoda]
MVVLGNLRGLLGLKVFRETRMESTYQHSQGHYNLALPIKLKPGLCFKVSFCCNLSPISLSREILLMSISGQKVHQITWRLMHIFDMIKVLVSNHQFTSVHCYRECNSFADSFLISSGGYRELFVMLFSF